MDQYQIRNKHSKSHLIAITIKSQSMKENQNTGCSYGISEAKNKILKQGQTSR
jgi:hypothetical protein